MVKLLLGGAVGAVVLGGAAFGWGLAIPDERAGEAATLAAKIGAGVGLVVGAGVAALFF
jgi:hypothetical protein